MSCNSCQKLMNRIEKLEKELHILRSKKEKSEQEDIIPPKQENSFIKCDLSNSNIQRYSRQIILPEISVKGQRKLQDSSVLIVGTGGLGCPSAQYLAAAGIGCIGFVDHDTVELSNLHRQVLHREDTIGMEKVDSAIQELKRLNSSVKFNRHVVSISSRNASEIIKEYDIILDCTDNVATRYLLNDTCIFANKTLISGSALRFEGQLTVYNHNNSPCYRCLYPEPPPAATVTNCSDGGVVGAITGVIGALQALEAINIITTNKSSYAGKLLMFDGSNGSFKVIKLRKKQDDCKICGLKPVITKLQDYEQFCGTQPTDKEIILNLLQKEERITVQGYSKLRLVKTPHLLVDVRQETEFEICSLTGSINIPINDILKRQKLDGIVDAIKKNEQVYLVCKRGNDSQKAVKEIRQYVDDCGLICQDNIKDIIGGLTSWSKNIDNSFPSY